MRLRRPVARALRVALLLAAVAAPSGAAAEPPARTVPADAPISAYSLPPPLRARAEAYAHAHHVRYVVEILSGLAGLALLVWLRVAARLGRFAERRAQRRILQAMIVGPGFVLALGVIDLPTAIWSHVLQRRYEQSIQGWPSWARDWAVAQLLAIVLGTFLIWLLYAILRRAPRRWWLWTWLALLPVMLFLVVIEPFVVEPLFFKFDPLAQKDPRLAASLARVVHNAGLEIPESRMFLMEASAKLNAVNAYVTGLGASKRVVVWDTTVRAMSPREIEYVFGHELGHYVLGHVAVGLALGALALLVALFAGAGALRWVCRTHGPGWGIARPDEWGSLPIILFAASLLGTIASPLTSAVSRRLEHQADAFGLRVVSGVVDDPPQAAAHAFQRLGEIDLAEPDPSPLAVLWLYDHPPIRDRVAFVLGD